MKSLKDRVKLLYPSARFENYHEIKFDRKKPKMAGLKLYRFTVAFGAVMVDFDVRECWDWSTLADDLESRDFTINTLYLYKDKDDLRILYSQRVSFISI